MRIRVEAEVLKTGLLGGDSDPTPGPRAIERPIPPDSQLLHASGRLLCHHFSDSVAMIQNSPLAFPVMQDSPAFEERPQLARASARGCALGLAGIGKTHNHDQQAALP